MQTQTLEEAISTIKSKDYKVRFNMLLGIYSVYSIPFHRIKVLSIFEDVPANLKWESQDEFSIKGVKMKPQTIADFISIMSSLGYSLSPRMDNKTNDTFLVLWKRRRI